MAERENAFLLGQFKQLHEDSSRYFRITESTMAAGSWNLQVGSHSIQLETTQCRQETTSQHNGIKTIDRKSLTKQLCLICEKADIETNIMSNQASSLNKLQKIRHHLLSGRSLVNHGLRDTCELDNKGGQTSL